LTELTVEGGFNHNDFNEGDQGSIRKDGAISIGGTLVGGVNHVGGVRISCPDTAANGCRYVFKDGKFHVSGGATGIMIAAPTAPAPSNPESAHWLSKGKVVAAVPMEAGNFEISAAGGAKVQIPRAGSTAGMTTGYKTADGSRVLLEHNRNATDTEARHKDYLVWGVWEEKQSGKTVRRTVVSGSVPYTGPKPTAGKATYLGPALGFVKHGTGKWADWRGTAKLTADFADAGKISGSIKSSGLNQSNFDASTAAIHAGQLQSISLKDDGSVAIVGFNADSSTVKESNAPSQGTWNYEYFGPPSGQPTGVAGTFSAVRPEASEKTDVNRFLPSQRHGDVHKLEVTGAFGAEE